MAQLELPVYEAKRSTDFPGFVVVTCPRDDCPGTKRGRVFVVHEGSWFAPNRVYAERSGKEYRIVGRSCPYCFRASRLPNRRGL